MRARSLILMLAALLLAGGTAFLARNWLAAGRQQMVAAAPAPPATPAQAVLVAKAGLPAGLFLREEHLRWQAWPDETLESSYILKDQQDIASLVGAVVRRGIAAGEPITETRIARPGERGFLAAVLKPGMRAVAIRIDDTTGIAGLVFPGDRVDIILTQTLPATDEGEREKRTSETVLENVRILAIDQTLNDQTEEPTLAETATIELTPKQVEMITLVAELGRLSLSLRSLGQAELMAAEGGAPAHDGSAMPEAPAGAPSADAGGAPPLDPIAAIEAIPEPERGETYTFDSEVSRVLSRGKSGGRKVTVINGSTITEVQVE